MVERLGQVLYWAGCAGAALAVVLAAAACFVGRLSDNWPFPILLLMAGAFVWALGRACRYVLAGT